MLKEAVKNLLAQFGYELKKKIPNWDTSQGFLLYQYLKDDGSFDYEKYRNTQVAGNKRKIENIWVSEENIAFLSDYIKDVLGSPKFGICHGTRRGKEQEWFRKYLNCEVIGTEISDTATQFPHTIQWDFHEVKPEWINAVDFIYSNSIDHSYNPELCLNAWLSCVRPGGLCVLEHSSGHNRASDLDPFGADIALMPYLIATWSKGQYGVREIKKAPNKNSFDDYAYFIVIQKF